MRSNVAAIAIGILAMSGAARAQPVPSPAEAPAGKMVAGEDAQIAAFARTTVKLHAMPQATPQQMAEVITQAGLTIERYNEIAERMQKEPGFQAKVNAALVAAQSQAPGTISPASAAPPALPTDGVGGSVLSVLDKVCLPMVRSDQPISKIGPQAGLKLNKRDNAYVTVLGIPPYSIAVLPRGANQTVCNVQIRYPLQQGKEIAKALNIWTMHQQPDMKMVRNDVAVGADGLQRTTLSWEQSASGRRAGLVLVRVKRADGAPVEPGVGSATLLYTEQASAAG